MLDLGASELLLIVIVAIVVIGPKDLPLAMRTAGRWIGKVRRISGHFRSGIETMIREAELEEMEKKWKAQNEAIMTAHPDDGAGIAPPASAESAVSSADNGAALDAKGGADAAPVPASGDEPGKAEPQLPLPPP